MRILIYSETDAAKQIREKLRAEGHHASLRNPHLFNPAQAQFDKNCDLVIADDQTILETYAKAGIKAERMTAEVELGDFEPLPPADDAEKVSEPLASDETEETEEPEEADETPARKSSKPKKKKAEE